MQKKFKESRQRNQDKKGKRSAQKKKKKVQHKKAKKSQRAIDQKGIKGDLKLILNDFLILFAFLYNSHFSNWMATQKEIDDLLNDSLLASSSANAAGSKIRESVAKG